MRWSHCCAQQGVEVVVADSVDEVERAATPDTMLLVAETANNIRAKGPAGAASGDARRPADFEPVPDARDILSPAIRMAGDGATRNEPDCPLREGDPGRHGMDGPRGGYCRAVGPTPGGPVLRRSRGPYESDGRTVTVAGTSDFGDQWRPAWGR